MQHILSTPPQLNLFSSKMHIQSECTNRSYISLADSDINPNIEVFTLHRF